MAQAGYMLSTAACRLHAGMPLQSPERYTKNTGRVINVYVHPTKTIHIGARLASHIALLSDECIVLAGDFNQLPSTPVGRYNRSFLIRFSQNCYF